MGGSQANLLDASSAVTDDAGRFAMTLETALATDAACMRLRATPRSGTLPTVTHEAHPITIGPGSVTRPTSDTARVALVLR